jgi:hypothetical protein
MKIKYNSLSNGNLELIKANIKSQFLNLAELRLNQMAEAVFKDFTDDPVDKNYIVKFNGAWEIAEKVVD